MFTRINYKFLIQLFTNEILYYKHKIILITLKYILVTIIVSLFISRNYMKLYEII